MSRYSSEKPIFAHRKEANYHAGFHKQLSFCLVSGGYFPSREWHCILHEISNDSLLPFGCNQSKSCFKPYRKVIKSFILMNQSHSWYWLSYVFHDGFYLCLFNMVCILVYSQVRLQVTLHILLFKLYNDDMKYVNFF